MKRLFLILGVVIVAVVLGAIGVLYLSVREWESPDFLVKQLEMTFNCRAEIKSAKLEGFGASSSLEVSQLHLAPRDEFVEKGTPLKDRPPMVPSITIDTVFIQVEPWQLLNDRVVIHHLKLEAPVVNLRVFEDGSTSLDDMLRLPERTKQLLEGATNPTASAPAKITTGTASVAAMAAAAAPAASAETPAPEKKPAGERERKTFKASQLPMSAFARRVEIDDGTVNATIEKTKYSILLDRLTVFLTDIDIDPKALEQHNSANLEIFGKISVDSLIQNMRFAELDLEGDGAIQPFAPGTGEFMPSLSATVKVKEESYIDAMPLLDQIEGLLKELDRYGIDMNGVRLRGDFSEETSVSFEASRELIKVTSDFMVPVDENYLVIEKDSWVNPGKNDHQFKVTFIASERLTKKAEDEMQKFLESRAAGLGTLARDQIMSRLKQDKFLVVGFVSKGDLGKPDVTPVLPFEDVNKLFSAEGMDLKKEVESMLRSVLGGGNKEPEPTPPAPVPPAPVPPAPVPPAPVPPMPAPAPPLPPGPAPVPPASAPVPPLSRLDQCSGSTPWKRNEFRSTLS